MSENTYGKDLVDSLKEPVLEDPVALCAEAASEIERLRASEAQAHADIEALADACDDCMAENDPTVKAALSRAADRRAKKEATNG